MHDLSGEEEDGISARLLRAVARVWPVCFAVVLSYIVGCDVVGYFRGPGDTVYVTASVLNLRKRPTTKAPVLVRLRRGDELAVLQKDGKWMKVKVDSNTDRVGWVHADYVGTSEGVRAALRRDLKRRKRPRRGRPTAPLEQRADKRLLDGPSLSRLGLSTLGLSKEDFLEGFPDGLEVETLDPIADEQRHVGAVADGQVVVEFWGNPEDLSRASVMVSVVDVPGEDLTRNAGLAVRFVRNAVPQWRRNGSWMVDKLRELTRLDTGEGGFDTNSKKVRFKCI